MAKILVAILMFPLCACANTGQLNSTLDTLAKNYAHCDRTVNYSVSVGALNPGSGAQVQGTVHCPPLAIGPDGQPLLSAPVQTSSPAP